MDEQVFSREVKTEVIPIAEHSFLRGIAFFIILVFIQNYFFSYFA